MSQRAESQGGQTLAFRRGPAPRKRTGGKFDRNGPPRKPQTPKKRRLNLRKMEEVKWELSNALDGLSDNLIGTLKGSIIAKADKMSIKDAFEFIEQKEKEGMISTELADKLIHIVKKYSTYR